MSAQARVEGGEVVATRLPRTGRLSDGRTVTNYPALPSETLHAEGWRQVVDDGPPSHDPETERVRRTGHVYDDETDVVRVTYEVVDRPPPEPDPADDEHHDPQVGAPGA